MREIRTYGSEGGVMQVNASSLPLSTISPCGLLPCYRMESVCNPAGITHPPLKPRPICGYRAGLALAAMSDLEFI